MEIKFSTPFKLPANWKRKGLSSLKNDQTLFPRNLTIDEALRYLADEINHLQASAATVFTNYEFITSPRLRKQVGIQTGASLQIKIDGHVFLLVCDSWSLLEQNIYSLHLIIRSYRNIEQYTGMPMKTLLSQHCDVVKEDVSNEALSYSTSNLPQWMLDLGIGPSATLEDAHAIYRYRAKSVSDDENAILELNIAMDKAKMYLS